MLLRCVAFFTGFMCFADAQFGEHTVNLAAFEVLLGATLMALALAQDEVLAR